MFVVPRRQQSPGTAEASGERFLLSCLGSWHSGAAGMLCQEREGSEDRASSAACLVCSPSFPALMARTSPIPTLCQHSQEGPAVPHNRDAKEEQEDVPAYSSIPTEQESGPSAAQGREEGRQRGKETLER